MKKLSSSPERFSFQKEKYLERQAKEGKTPENNEEVAAMNEYYIQMAFEQGKLEQQPEWSVNNMEHDLRSTEWICNKVKQDDIYAQNLYAAMCNNDFQKLEVVPILTEKRWSCSWRHAGGIIADMREEGDYIDWYCSGIRDDYQGAPSRDYVPESVVTDEIREDLKQIGWIVRENDEEY